MRGGVVVVGAVGGDVDEVRLSTAGHRDIQVLPRRRRISERMGGVRGDALRPMARYCVSQINVIGDIVSGEDHGAATVRAAGGE